MGPWIGIDYGRRRIGLAVSDAAGKLSFPLETIAAGGGHAANAARVVAAARDHDPIGYVIGLPLNMDGSVGPQAELSQAFAAALRQATGERIELIDERLTSFQADELMEHAGVPRGQRAAQRDAFAAQVILMTFLAQRATPE